MCFQGFATCSCGHTLLVEKSCELAADIPFYIKVACPNYSYTRKETDKRACGAMGFYCRETRVGKFLEQAYSVAEQAQVRLNKINVLRQPVNVQAAKFNAAANSTGVSQAARRLHPAYQAILGQSQALEEGRQEATQRRMAALTVLQEGMKYYQIRIAHFQKKDGSNLPPFALPASLRSTLPGELQAHLDRLVTHDIANTDVGAKIIDTGHDRSDLHEQPRGHSCESDNTHMTSENYGNLAQDSQGMPSALTSHDENTATQNGRLGHHSPHKQSHHTQGFAEYDGNTGKLNAFDQRAGLAKKPKLVKESSSVRRSARVRDKKVSYAESEQSTVHSRESSPVKSDGGDFSPLESDRDDFSPPKSDVSTSPERKVMRRRAKVPSIRKECGGAGERKLGRSNTTLSGMIDEWNRRTVAARNTPPNAQQQIFRGTSSGYPTHGQIDSLKAADSRLTRSTLHPLADGQSHTQRATSLNQPLTNTPAGCQSSPVYDFLTPTQHNMGTLNSMRIQAVPGIIDYSPSTPGQVNLSPYQYGMYIRHPMSTEVPTTSYQSAHFQTPLAKHGVNRNWLINTPSFNNPGPQSSLQAEAQSNLEMSVPLERNDSVFGVSAYGRGTRANNPPSVDLDYQRMCRSFSATAEWTPPASANPTSTNTDPKKRSLAASSPLPSSKRMCLSLPGEDTTQGSTLPCASSPEKSLSRSLNRNDKVIGELTTDKDEDLPVMPAPILVPTAVMYAPSRDGDAHPSTDFVTTAGSLAMPAPEGDVGDDVNNHSSEIDWGFLNDDMF